MKFIGHTFLLNIEDDEETIFKKFDYKSARYAINKAKRDGVLVKKVDTESEKRNYIEFHKLFCIEKGIPMFHEDELNELITYYAESSDGEYLGACSFIVDSQKETARYKYGATKHKLNANEIILWKAICDFHNAGYKFFDLGGIGSVSEIDKNSDDYKRYQFKKKFGGKIINSYTYIKTNGICIIGGWLVLLCVNIIWKGDTNSFVRWLTKRKILK